MLSTNDAILQLAVRHHVDVHAYSNGLVRSIIGQLNDASAELVDMIRKRGENGPFTTARLKAMVNAIQQMNADAFATLYNEMETPLFDFAAHEADSTSTMLNKATPIALDIVTPDIEKLKVMVTDSAIHGHLLKEWFDSLEASMSQKVTQQIRMGIVLGEDINTVVRRLTGPASDYEQGIFSIVRRQTEAIVRTAVVHVSNQAAIATYRANSDIIKGLLRLETLDVRTCKYCMAKDHIELPLDSSDLPPSHIGCRGFTSVVLKSWQELGIPLSEIPESTRASMTGQVPESMDYNQWLKTQSAATQDEALGPMRGKLFREGSLDVQDFTNNKGKTYTLADLKERETIAYKKAFGD